MKSFLLWLLLVCALAGCSGSGENINLPAADLDDKTATNLSWFKRAAMDTYCLLYTSDAADE